MTEVKTSQSKHEIKAGEYTFTFLNSGDLYHAFHQDTMINQWFSNPIDGSLNNIYLRIYKDGSIDQVKPLLGVKSNSQVTFGESEVLWYGEIDQLSYEVTFTLTEKGVWFWDIQLHGKDVTCDVVYGQDLGLGKAAMVRTNEAYTSQYIDHKVLNDENLGYIVCSRQNQSQEGDFPYLQQGCLTKATGYCTDGFQFFGQSFKESNTPEILANRDFPNLIYQYEFAYTGLVTNVMNVNGNAVATFYGLFKSDHALSVDELEFQNDLREASNEIRGKEGSLEKKQPMEKVVTKIGQPLKTEELTEEEIAHYFPRRQLEEKDNGELLAFFTDTYEHVVLKKKEMLVERPHGHILMTGNNHKLETDVLTTTSYMYGIFNSQLVVGNTSFNKMLTNARNHLNVMKTSGQRIYIEANGSYQLLTMPSVYEIGFNYNRWYYKTNDDLLIITNYTIVDSPELHLHVRSVKGKKYRFMVTNQVSMNNNEYEVPFNLSEKDGEFIFSADEASDSKGVYPNLEYSFSFDADGVDVGNESELTENVGEGAASLVVFKLDETDEWALTMYGALHGEKPQIIDRDFSTEVKRYREYYETMMNDFQLSFKEEYSEDLEKMNALTWWYTHNMLVHYSVPHGLEQYGGAAWGTRDVCQGPVEYFFATHKYEQVKDIIRKVYAHQYDVEGNWPQWFMIDDYYKIQQTDSHGDIIIWPLKVISDYLKSTKDFAILDEELPYTSSETFAFTEKKETLLDHIKKQLSYIQSHFLHDTYLSSYGDGDWDDTLQPANQDLKQYMVSSWTVSLTYQVINQLSEVLEEVDPSEAAVLKEMSTGIQADFTTHMLDTDVIPGFLYMEDPENPEKMLHPEDTKTGIDYRLLPMTRSMISELLSPEQAEHHYTIIKDQLACPDGVRLMNQPAKYTGGVSTHFKRAEQAANFGREIGLQYVHAHIRYVEAMAKLGKEDEVWHGLQTINPIRIQDVVPNAEHRQSNAYFSSSDGKFNTRYEAADQFHKLKEGKVAVKGGWRIYSSGPGIYMNQLISQCLGIREEGGDLIIDPMLPNSLNGVSFKFRFHDYKITFVFHLEENEKRLVLNGENIPFESLKNRYRDGGFKVNNEVDFKKNSENIMEVFLK
ncbi:cellobiose phosphorylase [Salipaludibacillus keqinensis]|uniref:Cellobiose phosphorylase n=1 Tax=Salipaludibacillus keqinensis TaxID=2045207 RepID=A0A323TD53_9BACI|nr:cellobiose phosphorylase [Salipaludibacillus keqinensis]PYZ92690.1 cellobiose phosphorylase [Salipaludibacillus keqinensis]